MSSYFDTLSSEVAKVAGLPTHDFLTAVREIEERLYNDVTIITGVRQRMLGVLATEAIYQPGRLEIPPMAVERVVVYRSSRAVESIHELFHDLAQRRLETRFGRWSDNPPFMRALRDEHDEAR